jgi:sugar O-acyltransferase (sialic acid O-acetyltransferase NeuD family)
MANIVIFGAGEIAEIAYFYFKHDSEYEVSAFCVDQEYLSTDQFCGLPVVAFEDLEKHYAPSEYQMFIALSYSKVNVLRAEKYHAAKDRGYTLVSYISSRATTFPGLQVGDNCFILEDNTIQPFVTIGNNVTLWSGNHIGHHSRIEDNCFIASHVVVSGGVTIGENCFLGVNVTLRDHITLGRSCVIGAGALIVKDTEDSGVYVSTIAERSRVPSHRLKKI